MQWDGLKMYCSKCGKEIDDDAGVCVNCGYMTKKQKNYKISQSKAIDGMCIALVLGIIVFVFAFIGRAPVFLTISLIFWILGLVMGIIVYSGKKNLLKTFLKGWFITAFIEVIIFSCILIISI